MTVSTTVIHTVIESTCRWPCLSTEGAAAWMQAIGSVAALVVAIYVSRSALTAQAKQQKVKALRFASVFLELARDLVEALQPTEVAFGGVMGYQFPSEDPHTKRAMDAVETFPIVELPDSTFVVLALAFRYSARICTAALWKSDAGASFNFAMINQVAADFKAFEVAYAALHRKEILGAYIARRAGSP